MDFLGEILYRNRTCARGELIKFDSADSHAEGHERHRRKICLVPKEEDALCINDAALYTARV